MQFSLSLSLSHTYTHTHTHTHTEVRVNIKWKHIHTTTETQSFLLQINSDFHPYYKTSFLVLLTRVSLLMATKLVAIGQDVLYNVSYSRKFFEGENFRGLVTLNVFAFWFPRRALVSEATPINRPCVGVRTSAWVKVRSLIFAEWSRSVKTNTFKTFPLYGSTEFMCRRKPQLSMAYLPTLVFVYAGQCHSLCRISLLLQDNTA